MLGNTFNFSFWTCGSFRAFLPPYKALWVEQWPPGLCWYIKPQHTFPMFGLVYGFFNLTIFIQSYGLIIWVLWDHVGISNVSTLCPCLFWWNHNIGGIIVFCISVFVLYFAVFLKLYCVFPIFCNFWQNKSDVSHLRTLSPGLVWCNDNIGGDEESPVFSWGNNIVCFVPHLVQIWGKYGN